MLTIELIKENFVAGEAILFDNFKEITNNAIPEKTLRKQVERLTKSGKLIRPFRGTYIIKEKGILGDKPLNFDSFIEKKYLTDGNDVYGYYTGITQLNRLGISYQKANTKEVITNNEKSRKRLVNKGNRKLITRKTMINITKNNYLTLQFLEMICIYKYYSDIDLKLARDILINFYLNNGVTKESILEYVDLFKNNIKKILEEEKIYDEFA